MRLRGALPEVGSDCKLTYLAVTNQANASFTPGTGNTLGQNLPSYLVFVKYPPACLSGALVIVIGSISRPHL